MSQTYRLARASAAVLLASTVVALLGGCSWFGKGAKGDYALSAEARPLEVPPDLNLPDTSGAMALPPTASAARAAAAAPAASSTAFTVAGTREQVFGQVGAVLDSLDGLDVASRSELLGTFDVSYQGQNFLLRVAAVEGGVHVAAVDPRGVAAAGEAPRQVIAAVQKTVAGR
ncbi:MAG: hypothetical protein U0T03_03890 [Xanthomonadales bacterium]|nr:hypothetical protein [Pseudoxanthomonas sp.]MDZ3797929.1 hypothetical protein [Xanthomonadales bacterium]